MAHIEIPREQSKAISAEGPRNDPDDVVIEREERTWTSYTDQENLKGLIRENEVDEARELIQSNGSRVPDAIDGGARHGREQLDQGCATSALTTRNQKTE